MATFMWPLKNQMPLFQCPIYVIFFFPLQRCLFQICFYFQEFYIMVLLSHVHFPDKLRVNLDLSIYSWSDQTIPSVGDIMWSVLSPLESAQNQAGCGIDELRTFVGICYVSESCFSLPVCLSYSPGVVIHNRYHT